jgi:serine/threonine protein phosphatase 1
VKKTAKLCHNAGVRAISPRARRAAPEGGAKFLKFGKKSDKKTASAPEGLRLYAIGDIHGRLDLLQFMLDLIECDQHARPPAPVALIFLGDYIDRGADSKGVVERLLQEFPEPFSPVFLKGNHEDLLLSFVRDPAPNLGWLRNGGDAALLSYGVDAETVRRAFWDGKGLAEAARQFKAVLPPSHLAFYENLRLSCRFGDYFFAHAGVRPGAPLDEQSEEDLLWIRHEFLGSSRDFGAVVVHGHTPARLPQERGNRIGLDTYAVKTGKLTAAGFEGPQRWFLST